MEIITSAQNPVLFVGAGVQLSQATEELRLFAEALGIPIVSTSWGGRGVISDDHPLFAGVVGSFGWNSANEIVQKAAAWIAIGTTFSQMTTGAWNRSEEHTSELQSLMRTTYAVFCLKKKKK